MEPIDGFIFVGAWGMNIVSNNSSVTVRWQFYWQFKTLFCEQKVLR